MVADNITYSASFLEHYHADEGACLPDDFICISQRTEVVMKEMREERKYNAIAQYNDDTIVILMNSIELRLCKLSGKYETNRLCS